MFDPDPLFIRRGVVAGTAAVSAASLFPAVAFARPLPSPEKQQEIRS
jgi:hypothetical protein